MVEHYVDRKSARASYRPQNVMSPGLQRAREPFRLRNAITGLVLTGFAVGVWAYSISAVKQDAFDDVDEEARALMAGLGSRIPEEGAGEGQGAADASKSSVVQGAGAGLEGPSSSDPVSSAFALRPRRGVLPRLLEHRVPRAFDPSTGTFIWGAPPVDNIGRLGSSNVGIGSRRI